MAEWTLAETRTISDEHGMHWEALFVCSGCGVRCVARLKGDPFKEVVATAPWDCSECIFDAEIIE